MNAVLIWICASEVKLNDCLIAHIFQQELHGRLVCTGPTQVKLHAYVIANIFQQEIACSPDVHMSFWGEIELATQYALPPITPRQLTHLAVL